MSRFTRNCMSGKADFACCHHSCSWPRTSVPTWSGLTRWVTWLTKSSDQNSKTAVPSPASIAALYAPSIRRLSDIRAPLAGADSSGGLPTARRRVRNRSGGYGSGARPGRPAGGVDMTSHRSGLAVVVIAVLATALLACAPVDPVGSRGARPPAPVERSRYIMPPGNYGGLPTSPNSTDQIPLYDALTPLRGHVTDADIDRDYLPENFAPVGQGHVEATGRPGTTIVYDGYGVPHISGLTRADLAFGAGWVTARDRSLLLQLGRGPARVAVADVPGINAFGLVTSGQSFVPSAATEQLVTDQVQRIVDTYGAKGRDMLAEMQAEADGITAYNQSHGVNQAPATVNDVIAVTAFIGSIFGAGGGAEASNAEFLATLRNHLGGATGHKAWLDAMLFDDPEAPTTLTQRFDYGPLTGGAITGSVAIDENSIVSLDPRNPSTGPTPALAATAPVAAAAVTAPVAAPTTTT